MTQGNSMIHVPKLKVYGAGDLNRIMPFSFDGEIAEQIGNYGKVFYKLHKDSITLGDQAALFQWYLASELGEAPEMPEDVKDAVYGLFDKKGYGNITDDACDYDNGDKGHRMVKSSDLPVLWTVRPGSFLRTDDGWKVEVGEDSEQFPTHVPKTGHAELTCDGIYMPVSGSSSRPKGVPFSTVETRRVAEKTFTDRGYTQEFARKAVSKFWSMEEGQGTASVGCWVSNAGLGRFGVFADCEPDDRGPGKGFGLSSFIGSFPASRSAEQIEAPKNSGKR